MYGTTLPEKKQILPKERFSPWEVWKHYKEKSLMSLGERLMLGTGQSCVCQAVKTAKEG